MIHFSSPEQELKVFKVHIHVSYWDQLMPIGSLTKHRMAKHRKAKL